MVMKRGTAARAAAVLTAAGCLAVAVAAPAASAAVLFSAAPGELPGSLYAPAVFALPEGKVLVAGGYDEKKTYTNAAALYSPSTGTLEALAHTEVEGRDEAAYLSLRADGRPLIIGGSNATQALKTIEEFDPASRTFEKLGLELAVARTGAVAVQLADGRVLVAGGYDTTGLKGVYRNTAEIISPEHGTAEPVPGLMTTPRFAPAAGLLPDGRVLIAGGAVSGPPIDVVDSAEVFDPATGTFQALPAHLTVKREEAAFATLPDGKVVIAGGWGGPGSGEGLRSAEAFNPETGAFEALPAALGIARTYAVATPLPGERFLIVGGAGNSGALPRSLEALSLPPSASTGAASGVTSSQALLAGTAVADAAASAHFQYGTSAAYGMATPSQALTAAIRPHALSATVAGLAASTTYHYRLVSENAAGVSYGVDETFTTAAPAPAISALTQSHRRWRRGRALARISARAPLGTTFSFALNTPASVTFTFTSQAPGRSVAGRCVGETRANRGRPRCSRTVPRGLVVLAGHAGRNSVAFQGRLSRTRTLPAGSYTLVAVASGPGGVSAPARLAFTISG